MKTVGLYLHIPFCVRKCLYCDFASWSGRENYMAPYADRAEKEIRRKSRRDIRLGSVFIGGGTPSVFPLPLMERLLKAIGESFDFAPGWEGTMEMNPGTVTPEGLALLRSHGFSRISMGMQCAQDALLKKLGRIHCFRDVEKGAALIREAGFDNFNLDLMLGLPGQRIADVEESIRLAVGLKCTHLSCYGLIVEEGTPLEARVSSGEWVLPEVEEEREMYDRALVLTAQAGFRQYEISNFALPGRECRHNLHVWRRGEYIGVGCAAAGFMDGVRYQNPLSLSDYLKGVPAREEAIGPREAMFESVMLGLRLNEGLSDSAFYLRHGAHLEDVYGKRWTRALKNGLLSWDGACLRLTRRGMDVQNSVLVDLMEDE